MKLHSVTGAALGGVVGLACLSIPAMAGSFNQVYITQDGTGNTLYVDQSAASDAKVGGFSATPELATLSESPKGTTLLAGSLTNPASQAGGGNAASITFGPGQGSFAALKQNNSGPLQNTATIALAGDRSFAGIFQNGTGNKGSVKVHGDLTAGGLIQNGDSNDGTVEVSGGGAGLLIQNGDRNTTELTGVTGSNSRVTYIINGSGITTAGAQAARIITNSAAVTITQTSGFTPTP